MKASDQIAALNDSIRATFNLAETEKRPLTEAERNRISTLEQTADALGRVPPGRKTSPSPFPAGEQHAARPGRSPLCADLFGVDNPTDGGFSSVEDLARAIQVGDTSRLLATGNSGGIPADGGFAVPEAFAFEALDKMLESEVVRPRARNYGMEGETLNVSTFDDHDHSSGQLFGGLYGEWLPEGGSISAKISKLRRMKLIAKKLAFITASTNELLNDSPTFEGEFTKRMQQAISWNLDRAFLISGTGAGQPRSILNDPALVTVAKETGQAADSIIYENLAGMFSRLHPACIGNSVWVCNATAIPQLLRLSVSVGTGGDHVPVMTGGSGKFEILTRPVVFTEKCNPVGDLGDVLLVDFSQYAVGMLRNGIRLARSEHVYYTTDETAWRITVRADGQGTWQQAFTPANGSTLSWCVALAART